jgi:hypothetical protein
MGTKFTVPYRRWYDKEKKGPVHKAVGDRFAAALNFLCPLGWQFDQLTEEISTKNPDACKDYMKANAAKGDWCCCLCKVVDTDVRLVMQVGYPNSITRVFKKFRQEFDANEIAVVDSIDVIMTDRAFQMDGKDFTFDEVLGHELCTHGKLFIEQRHPSPADMRIDWKTADNKQKLAYEQAVIDRAEEDKMRKLHDPSLSPRAPVKAIPDGKDHYKKDASTPLMPIGEAVYDQIFPRVKKP